MGFVLIPSPVILLTNLMRPMHTLVCVCLKVHTWANKCTQGCLHHAPLSFLCSKFTPSCPYSPCQFLPCSPLSVGSAGLMTAEQALAVFPPLSAITSLRGILLLLLLHSPRPFSDCERQLLLFLWILAENLLLESFHCLKNSSWTFPGCSRRDRSYKSCFWCPQFLACFLRSQHNPVNDIWMDCWLTFITRMQNAGLLVTLGPEWVNSVYLLLLFSKVYVDILTRSQQLLSCHLFRALSFNNTAH